MAEGLTIGPMDVDAAGDLVASLGTHNKADRLLQRHRQMYPPELTLALALPRDAARSEALDHDEVEEALRGLEGRRAFFKEDCVLEDAAVRGDTRANRVVSVVFRAPSGRTARGVFPYEKVPTSQRRFEERQAEVTEQRLNPVEQPAASMETRDAATEQRLQLLERELRQTREALEAVRAEKDQLSDPEPWEGYDEQNADAITARLQDGVNEFGQAGLERLLDYEEKHKNRAGVKSAIDRELSKA